MAFTFFKGHLYTKAQVNNIKSEQTSPSSQLKVKDSGPRHHLVFPIWEGSCAHPQFSAFSWCDVVGILSPFPET